MEDDTISSPTRLKKVDSFRSTAKPRSKAVEELQVGTKAHTRARRDSQPNKPQQKVLFSQSNSSDLTPAPVRLTAEFPRRTKSNPANITITPQPPTAITAPQQQQQNLLTNTTTKPPQLPPVPGPQSSLISSKNPESSPIMTHRQAPPGVSVVIPPRKPALGSYVSVPAQPQHLDPTRQRLLDRAIKARLYYLRQSGPNKFLIGGDSLESRFHVNIGPQTCSCNKIHCIHLLFVMLRVLKVKPSSPMLWAKTLRNYEVEGLLGDFQTRVKQRTATPRRSSRKKFDFLRRSPDLRGDVGGVAKSASTESGGSLSPSAVDSVRSSCESSPQVSSGGVASEEGGRGEEEEEEEEGGDSDKEEDLCPICLNELDEGEDLLICPGCSNHLHQHCMDIWAMEERRRNEPVHCPVCRTIWSYHMSSPSSNFVPDMMPVSVPVSGSGGVVSGRKGHVSSGSSGNLILSQQKAELLEKLKQLFGTPGVDGLFSPEWKARETALSLISREAISLLLSQMATRQLEASLRESEVKEVRPEVVQGVCMEVVKQACGDSVLKVFLASLELLKVVLVYSVCNSPQEAQRLQDLIQPILHVLLTRCSDAQRRVKDCSIEATCNLCLGQEGAWGLGSACGDHTSLPVTCTRYVLQVALSGQNSTNNWQWWLGRLSFMDRLISRFASEYVLAQCLLDPEPVSGNSYSDSESDEHSLGSGIASPSDSITSSVAMSMTSEVPYITESGPASLELESSEQTNTDVLKVGRNGEEDESTRGHSPVGAPPPQYKSVVERNLLMQMWYFAGRATHIAHPKVSKLARRVIIKVAKILRDDPTSLEIAHDVVGRCHRTQAEGLLDRVLQARESPYHASLSQQGVGVAPSESLRGSRRRREEASGGRNKLQKPAATRGHERTPSPLSSQLRVSHSPIPVASSSLKDHHEKVKGRRLLMEEQRTGDTRVKTPEMARPDSSASRERRKLSRQKSRGTTDVSEDFIPSDESFQSALSDLQDLDMSSNTLLAPEDEGERGVVDESSSASNSHDSQRSCGSHKQGTSPSSSSSSVEKGVEPVGVVSGFPNKPGFMNFPHMYLRQSTADSTSSDSLDVGWNMCKRNIEEEEAEALAKVRSMVTEQMPHPPLSGLIPPNPEVLIHVQPSKDGKKEETDGQSGGRPYIEGVHWVKGKLIGTGAFCSCFLARDMDNGTMFAVKQVSYVRNTQAQEAEELKRLRDEVSMLGRINHPNIVRCLGATQHDGHINIFVEWMAGGCLDQLLHDFGYFGENVICNYTKQITHGIVFLHENGIIHRDLKGGNILLDSTGRRLRIADFGAAARLATHTTGSGEFQNMEGTVAFMAPEVVKGGSEEITGYGRKCDVWSIGCVIIQMSTAKPPWAGTYDQKNKFQLIFKIGQATAPPPMPEFSNPALKDFTLQCLEVKPEDRPTSTQLLKHPLFTAF